MLKIKFIVALVLAALIAQISAMTGLVPIVGISIFVILGIVGAIDGIATLVYAWSENREARKEAKRKEKERIAKEKAEAKAKLEEEKNSALDKLQDELTGEVTAEEAMEHLEDFRKKIAEVDRMIEKLEDTDIKKELSKLSAMSNKLLQVFKSLKNRNDLTGTDTDRETFIWSINTIFDAIERYSKLEHIKEKAAEQKPKLIKVIDRITKATFNVYDEISTRQALKMDVDLDSITNMIDSMYDKDPDDIDILEGDERLQAIDLLKQHYDNVDEDMVLTVENFEYLMNKATAKIEEVEPEVEVTDITEDEPVDEVINDQPTEDEPVE